MTYIGRGLYVERLTAGSTAAARKCLLITQKKDEYSPCYLGPTIVGG
jgi:hypothetical protein